MKTDWQKNIRVYKIDSFLQWFSLTIGIWALYWRHYLTFTQMGTVQAIGLLVSLLLELPSGALADLVGRKATVIISRLTGIIGAVMFVYADNFWMFTLAVIFYQSSWAFESGALSALLYDSLKENGREKKLYQKTEADTFFWCTLGMALSSVVGGWLYKFNPIWPYVGQVAVCVGALAGSLFFEEPKIDTEKFTLKNYLKQNYEGTMHIFRNGLIRQISFFSILISFVGYAGLWYLYEPRLAAGGFGGYTLGLLVAGTYLIRAVGIKLIPFAGKKLRDDQIPVFLTLIQMIGSACSFMENRTGAIISPYVRKFADGFRVPILARLQNDQIQSQYRATALSAISLFTNILISIAGPFIGMANDAVGVPKTLGSFFFIGLVMVLPVAIILSRSISRNQTNVKV